MWTGPVDATVGMEFPGADFKTRQVKSKDKNAVSSKLNMLLLLFNTYARTHSGPPSTRATVAMDGGVAQHSEHDSHLSKTFYLVNHSYHVNTMHAAEYHGCTRRPLPGSPAAARYSTETPLCFSWSAVTPLHALDLARVYEPQNMSPMHMTPPHHASDMPHPPRRFFTAATKPRIEDVAGPMLHGVARPTVPAGRRHRDR